MGCCSGSRQSRSRPAVATGAAVVAWARLSPRSVVDVEGMLAAGHSLNVLPPEPAATGQSAESPPMVGLSDENAGRPLDLAEGFPRWVVPDTPRAMIEAGLSIVWK